MKKNNCFFLLLFFVLSFMVMLPNLTIAEIKFYGNIRLRYEGQFQDDMDSRDRFRIRGRIGAGTEVTEEIHVGMRVTTGDPNDPTSPNQSFDDFFSGKVLSFDRFFINYRPEKLPFLELTGGKFANPLLTTEMFWDEDVNPDGASEKLTFRMASGFLNKVTLTFAQYIIDEVADGGDSYFFAGQGALELGIGQDKTLTLAGSRYTFSRCDRIAIALNRGLLKSGNTNRLARDANSGEVTGYFSDFDIVNFTALLDFKLAAMPVKFILDYANNLGADGENQGFWIETHWGNRTAQGDIDFDITYARIESDAVLAAFNNDDLPNTNFKGVEVNFNYQLLESTLVRFSGFFTNRVVVAVGEKNSLLTKVRLDAIVSF